MADDKKTFSWDDEDKKVSPPPATGAAKPFSWDDEAGAAPAAPQTPRTRAASPDFNSPKSKDYPIGSENKPTIGKFATNLGLGMASGYTGAPETLHPVSGMGHQMVEEGQNAIAHPVKSTLMNIAGPIPMAAYGVGKGLYESGKEALGGIGNEDPSELAHGIGRGIGQIGQLATLRKVPESGESATAGFRERAAKKLVSPMVYENVGEAAADRRMGTSPESGIVNEGHVAMSKEGLLKQMQSRVVDLKKSADNILQNHPNANTAIDAEPLIDQAINEAIKGTEKVAGGTDRLEALRQALKTKYGTIKGTPFEMNKLKTDIQSSANNLGAYKNTQPVEAGAADAMKNVARLIKEKVNESIPQAAELNNRMSDSIDAQAGLQKKIDAEKGRSIFGGFHEGAVSTMLNRTLGSAPIRTGAARLLNIGNVEKVPPIRTTPFAPQNPGGLAPVGGTPPPQGGGLQPVGTANDRPQVKFKGGINAAGLEASTLPQNVTREIDSLSNQVDTMKSKLRGAGNAPVDQRAALEKQISDYQERLQELRGKKSQGREVRP
jgi:hypothetical protein